MVIEHMQNSVLLCHEYSEIYTFIKRDQYNTIGKNAYENKAIPRFVTAFARPRIPLPKIAFMRLKMQRGIAAVLPSY